MTLQSRSSYLGQEIFLLYRDVGNDPGTHRRRGRRRMFQMRMRTPVLRPKSFGGRMHLLQEQDVLIVMSELGRIERSDREAFEAWDCETKEILLRLRNREQKSGPPSLGILLNRIVGQPFTASFGRKEKCNKWSSTTYPVGTPPRSLSQGTRGQWSNS